MANTVINVTDWKVRQSGTLRGFVSVHLPSGLTLHDVCVHARAGAWWISLWSKPMLQDGVVLREASGKVRYGPPLIAFASPEVRTRFAHEVIEALRRAQPELFAAERAA